MTSSSFTGSLGSNIEHEVHQASEASALSHAQAVEKFASDPVNRAWSKLRMLFSRNPEFAMVFDDIAPSWCSARDMAHLLEAAPAPFVTGYLLAVANSRQSDEENDFGEIVSQNTPDSLKNDVTLFSAMDKLQLEAELNRAEEDSVQHGFLYGLLVLSISARQEEQEHQALRRPLV